MKQEKVMEKVYHPRRLREAWRQVKKNAGAAGIDEKKGLLFSINSLGGLLNYRSVADRRAVYLAGMCRSVGRGWPKSHLLPDLIPCL